MAAWAKTSGPKYTSAVWAVFELRENNDDRTESPIYLECMICTKPSLRTWSRSSVSMFMLNQVKKTHSAWLLEYETSMKKKKKQNREYSATTTELWNHQSSTIQSYINVE